MGASGGDDFLQREREQAEQLRKLLEPTASLLHARIDDFETLAPPSVRTMLEMETKAMEQYRTLSKFPMRDLAATVQQPYADAIADLVAQAERNSQFVRDVLGSSTLRDTIALSKVGERLGQLDADHLNYIPRDAGLFQHQIDEAMTGLLAQLRLVVTSPIREAIDDLTETIARRPFLNAVTPAGTPTDTQTITEVREHVSELLTTGESLLGFLRRLAALLPQLPSNVANALLFTLLRFLLRYADPPKHEQRAAIRRTQRVLAAQLPFDERKYVRVAARRLTVRSDPHNRNSSIVGHLEYATPVVRLQHGRHWTLVERVSSETTMRGWVYTRYLRTPR